MNRKGLNAMPALLKFLLLLAPFLLASHSNAFISLSLVAGNHVWVNHFTQLQQPMRDPTKNQAANQFANQPNDWDMMHCFLLTFHQKVGYATIKNQSE